MNYHLKYWRHYFISHSRHGTHSPFVYKLVDEVIYQKDDPDTILNLPHDIRATGKAEEKKYLLVDRLLKVFAYDQFVFLTEKSLASYETLFKHRVGSYSFRKIYYVDQMNLDLNLLTSINDRDMLIVNEPYLSAEREDYWNKLKDDGRVVVTVDLYRIGLVFFRTGQRKENFLIRF
ncbi:hypothetical protein OHD16_22640 [Sphingobacterium sp. ML3W]|uniref:hypothetical protein n=1 Tax=Sphingobacterium sp. ML3W TaxID=1538644 RepID=UPI00249A7285|nr:hypothetical protein [Sphingobacterium sp. ML3W]WFA77515.1 hypothetical protein OGI71_15780 [Sphingobacterium sp. ML3W]